MARRPRSLPLHEEVALLALRNDRGTVAGGVMYAQAAGGAILAELLLTGHLRAVTEGRSTYVEPGDGAKTGSEVLDQCLELVEVAGRRRKVLAWVQKFAGLRRLHHRVAASLVDQGILRESEDRVLLLFKRRIYPELDPEWERTILSRLEAAIFSDAADVDPRTTVLVAIAHHAGLLKANFDRRRLRSRRARITAIIKGDAIGRATKEAIDAVHAAIVVATMMPAIIAASTASH